MRSLFVDYRVILIMACVLLSISFFAYFYINSRRKEWFKYYWKGFLLISVAGTLILLHLIIVFPEPFALPRKLITLIFASYGFYLIIMGGKKNKM